MRRGQASTEFVVLAGIMIVFFLVMTVAIQNQILQARDVQSENRVFQLHNVINNELLLAKRVHPTYVRNFYLPASLDGYSYHLYLEDQNNVLIIEYQDENYTFFVDDNTSSIIPLAPGMNVIRKN